MLARLTSALLLTLLLAVAPVARAADDTEGLVDRPLTLPAGGFEAWVPAHFNIASNEIGKPVFLNPSLYVGVAPGVSLGLRHFVGLCLGGTSNGCQQVYNDASIEAVISLGRATGWDGALRLAVNAAPIGSGTFEQFVNDTNSVTWAGEAGVDLRLRGRFVALTASPSVTFGLANRDTRARRNATGFAGFGTYHILYPGPITSNREFLSVPVTVQAQILPVLAVYAGGAYQSEIDPKSGSFGDEYAIPVTIGAAAGFGRSFEVGASLLWPNLLGKNGGGSERLANVFVGLRTP
jgi:hypothetical protein